MVRQTVLTLFSTPKPFLGHINVIQRNALHSWLKLHPNVEILLFGDDEGAAEVCQELGIRHVRKVKRNRNGTKYLSSIYDQAQELARHDLLCHVNCDILLLDDFRQAVERVARDAAPFLMAGRRWDLDMREPIDFTVPDWQERVDELAGRANRQRPAQWIDYFVFRRRLYAKQIPEFVIGRPGWDNWLLWQALHAGAKLIDASRVVRAVHQNHDYAYHPDGEKGVWEGEEAQENYALLDGHRKFSTLDDATHILKADGLHKNYRRWMVRANRNLTRLRNATWFRLLEVTRPLRHRIGLRQRAKV
jgi:hypothetical protein